MRHFRRTAESRWRAVKDLAIGVLTGKFEVPDHAMRLQVFDMLSPIAGSEGRVVEILAADSTDDAIRGLEVPEIMAGVGKKRVAQVGIGFPECILSFFGRIAKSLFVFFKPAGCRFTFRCATGENVGHFIDTALDQ